MGCDIHLHIEIKIDNEWHHYGCPHIKRNYTLFNKMAGVRGETKNAIIQPRGIPEDITKVTAVDWHQWFDCSHNASWFSLKEIKELDDWCEKIMGGQMKGWALEWDLLNTFLFDNPFTYPDPKECQDVRFVFWFDN